MKRPIAAELRLDQRKLPAQIFGRFVKRSNSRKEREERSQLAWQAFGKPGRDPNGLSSVLEGIAQQGGWTPHLKIAQLSSHWDQVVGPVIAQHSTVTSYEQGRLTIQARTTVWATQLTYMVPQLRSKISERLQMPVEEIIVTGPRSQQFSHHPFVRRSWANPKG
ncbi:hypothetical protein KIMH_00050 [Bombiscardovia apis]|uniref:DUF721 domain-containing protein n=1 Tax=Bombiscardovia apis TaxID=2932182 RepID=A0ABM8BAM3_9BIFI|nr:DUF721 domain-containing protein [Bombiscardovia apis]BDR53894.1 hypothetical protein KIMH_00050 [Bombiscardovia apis]